MHLQLSCIFVFITSIPISNAGQRLNEYVSHYELLDYDRDHVAEQHERSRRSSAEHAHIDIHFESHDRPFRMRLKRDTSVFHPDLQVVGHNGQPIDVDTTHFYDGYLLGEPDSLVFGSVRDGIFDGKIHSSNGTFYVERASKYFPKTLKHSKRGFHSVIYKEEHVVDPYREKRAGHVGGCGVTDNVAAWMDSVQHSAVDDDDVDGVEDPSVRHGFFKTRIESTGNSLFDEGETKSSSHWFKYSEAANRNAESNRRKRNLPAKPDTRSTCSLFIQTDPLLWKHIYEQEKRNAENTRKEITSLVAQHVKAVNLIYMDTRFDGRYPHRMTRFEVQRIKIDDFEACEFNYRGEENKFCLPNIDVSNFLNLHSQGNHSDFCLAYVFTYRDFTGGTLGLAWVASPSGASGGVCERHKTYTENIGGYPRTTKRSLNTGIITFVNYNSRVPPKVSQLTLAHEIGHNFGSPHDYPSQCRPGGQNGNYIMFASATSGDRPNNSKFSSCSVGNISSVLDAIYEGKKKNCFTDWRGAFCGNKIVEEGEECDCGYDDLECEESCCYPRIVSEEDRRRDPSAQGCTRRPGAKCSPSEGQCCTHQCTFTPLSQRQQCKEDGECSGASFCNGNSARCPAPPSKPDGTECNGNTRVCQSGECSGSICLKWGMRECFLTSSVIEDKRKLCELACQANAPNATCKGTSELSAITGLVGGILLRPGSPCDNYQGYCDVFLKCRAVDAEGPLARLKNLLFNKETLLTIAQWITEYWWAVLLMGVAFIIVMGVFIKCFAVHTPSSNPKKAPALSFTHTLRHPYSTLRRKRHHQPPPPDQQQEQHQQQQLTRPPVPAPRPGGPGGPARGYGEGRGHYSRQHNPPYSGQQGRSYAYEMRQQRV